ncbi:MAG: DUF3021 family protein [Acetatifactor sp.]
MENIIRRKIRFLLTIFTQVTTCVVFAVALFTTVVNPIESCCPETFWQILSVSMLCTLGCLIYPWDRPMKKWEKGIRILLHYLYINAVVLGAGVLFEWYQITHLKSVICMVLAIAVIYCIVSAASWTRSVREAGKLNEKLREYQKEEKSC